MTSWRDQAACLDHDPELFYAHEAAKTARLRDKATRTAFNICAACPVRQACYDEAIELGGTQHGILAGTLASERTAAIRERKRAGAA